MIPINHSEFFLIFTIVRFPGILASSFIGANIQERDYLPVILVSTIACILFVTGLLKKDLIIHKIHKLFHPKKEYYIR
ncbi:MAG: hypothetical protein ACM3X9_00070 [Bacillota bacterium]